MFRDPPKRVEAQRTLRASHRWVAAVQSAGDWRLPCRRTKFPFFIGVTAGAAIVRLPSAAVVTAAIVTARAVVARRRGASSAKRPRPDIKKHLTGVRTMLGTSASTGHVDGQGP